MATCKPAEEAAPPLFRLEEEKKTTHNLIHDVGFKAVGGFWCP